MESTQDFLFRSMIPSPVQSSTWRRRNERVTGPKEEGTGRRLSVAEVVSNLVHFPYIAKLSYHTGPKYG